MHSKSVHRRYASVRDYCTLGRDGFKILTGKARLFPQWPSSRKQREWPVSFRMLTVTSRGQRKLYRWTSVNLVHFALFGEWLQDEQPIKIEHLSIIKDMDQGSIQYHGSFWHKMQFELRAKLVCNKYFNTCSFCNNHVNIPTAYTISWSHPVASGGLSYAESSRRRRRFGHLQCRRLSKLPFSVPLSVGSLVSFLKNATSERTISLGLGVTSLLSTSCWWCWSLKTASGVSESVVKSGMRTGWC